MTLDPQEALAKRLSMQGALNKTNSTFFTRGTGGETKLGQVPGDAQRSTNDQKKPPRQFFQLPRNSYGPSRQGGKSILDPSALKTWFAGLGTSQQRYK